MKRHEMTIAEQRQTRKIERRAMAAKRSRAARHALQSARAEYLGRR